MTFFSTFCSPNLHRYELDKNVAQFDFSTTITRSLWFSEKLKQKYHNLDFYLQHRLRVNEKAIFLSFFPMLLKKIKQGFLLCILHANSQLLDLKWLIYFSQIMFLWKQRSRNYSGEFHYETYQKFCFVLFVNLMNIIANCKTSFKNTFTHKRIEWL